MLAAACSMRRACSTSAFSAVCLCVFLRLGVCVLFVRRLRDMSLLRPDLGWLSLLLLGACGPVASSFFCHFLLRVFVASAGLRRYSAALGFRYINFVVVFLPVCCRSSSRTVLEAWMSHLTLTLRAVSVCKTSKDEW